MGTEGPLALVQHGIERDVCDLQPVDAMEAADMRTGMILFEEFTGK
jgi:hypothetical protein